MLILVQLFRCFVYSCQLSAPPSALCIITSFKTFGYLFPSYFNFFTAWPSTLISLILSLSKSYWLFFDHGNLFYSHAQFHICHINSNIFFIFQSNVNSHIYILMHYIFYLIACCFILYPCLNWCKCFDLFQFNLKILKLRPTLVPPPFPKLDLGNPGPKKYTF